MSWHEARLKKGHHPSELYERFEDYCWDFHHFWDEPWWPGAYVVRLDLAGDRPLEEVEDHPSVDHVVRWDAEPDEKLYGDKWCDTALFFQAGSLLAPVSPFERTKLVHCFLNAQGLSWWGEFRFHLRRALRIPVLYVQWNLYLRRRWEREVGAPVKGEGEE